MLTHEMMMQSAMEERQREAARILRQHQAERSRGLAATPRSARTPKNERRHPLVSLVARIRAASAL